jgi:hypothetical protein
LSTSAGIATAASGKGSVARNPGSRGLTRRWKMKGSKPRTATASVQPIYAAAGVSPVTGILRQPKIRLGMKPKANIQRKPRRGFCVPTNHAPEIGPVHSPTCKKKNPRMNMLATARATICELRLARTSAGIFRFSFASARAFCTRGLLTP